MRSTPVFRTVARCALAPAVLIMGLAAIVTTGSGERRALGQEATQTTKTTEKKQRAKPRGRLPTYFARVVNSEQRQEIYDIQAKYGKQMEELQEQLDGLRKKQDEEVLAVLTDEQRAKVEEYQEAARKRRAERSKARTGTGQGNTKSSNE